MNPSLRQAGLTGPQGRGASNPPANKHCTEESHRSGYENPTEVVTNLTEQTRMISAFRLRHVILAIRPRSDGDPVTELQERGFSTMNDSVNDM